MKTDPESIARLECRLGQLEKSNRQLKALIVSLALLGGLPWFIAATGENPASAPSFSTEKLVLTSNGNPVATLTAGYSGLDVRIGEIPVLRCFTNNDGGGVLRICDPNTGPAVQFQSAKAGGLVQVYRTDTGPARPNPTGLAMALPRPSVWIGAVETGGVMEVRNSIGKRAAYLKATKNGGSLDISDQQGAMIGYFDATEKGVSLFAGKKDASSIEITSNLKDTSTMQISRGENAGAGFAYFSDSYASLGSGEQTCSISSFGFEVKNGNQTIAELRRLHTMWNGTFAGNPGVLRLYSEDGKQGVWISALPGNDGGQIRLQNPSSATFTAP